MAPPPRVHICDSAADLCAAALHEILAIVSAAAPDRRLSIALSGGSTPKALYRALKADHLAVAQQRFEYFFGDVRLVPDESPDSNYSMAHEALLHVVDPEWVHTIDTTTAQSSDDSAASYAALLRAKLPITDDGVDDVGCPQFDIVLLGVGPDGHTASLFPGTDASKERKQIVVSCMPNEGVTPYVPRVTITQRVIQAAKHVIVLGTGAEKKWVLQGIMASDEDIQQDKAKAPVARLVRECRGSVTLFVNMR